MAIRHFRRRDVPEKVVSSSSELSESSDDEHRDEHVDELVDEHDDVEHGNGSCEKPVDEKRTEVGPASFQSQDNQKPASSVVPIGSGTKFAVRKDIIPEKTQSPKVNASDDEDAEESDETEESSSSDDDYVLHKPVFLKRTSKPINNAFTDSQASGINKEALLTNIKEDNKRAEKNEELALLGKNNQTLNQDLLANILALDDDDSHEPEKEHMLWEERQQQRALRLRRLLEKKQAELEDYESAKMANASALNSDTLESVKQPTERALKTHSATPSASHSDIGKRKPDSKRHTANKARKYNPQSLSKADTKLQSEQSRTQAQDEQNEYSVI
ncbi:LAFA_0E15346g1_1 [Lachancea sp. 'fantastica']|nr:LAFA_0E15346g1_1 [Lachancea sp. 'fantastica']